MWFANIFFPSFCMLLCHSVDCFCCCSEAFKIDVVPLPGGTVVNNLPDSAGERRGEGSIPGS